MLLLILAAPAIAQDEEAKEESDRLARLLSSRDADDRAEALWQIIELGDQAIPILRAITTRDPEVIRALRVLVRRAQRIRLVLLRPEPVLALGQPLLLDVEMVNDTEEYYRVPVVRRSGQGKGTLSTFMISTGARMPIYLTPDEVSLSPQAPHPLVLRPGDAVRFSLRLEGDRLPFRRPGAYEVGVEYVASDFSRVRWWNGRRGRAVKDVESRTAHYWTDRVTLEAKGRSPKELEAALANKRSRASAVAELTVREDDAVLPLLRKHIEDEDLRLIALRELGVRGEEKDFELVRAATEKGPMRVRQAAVVALGGFDLPAARRRLRALVGERGLEEVAVRGLARRKDATTIACFIRILKRPYRQDPRAQVAKRALQDWTGIPIKNRASEIAAFERWWIEHREQWIRENVRER
ncbi:MAG: HEAT repeat domain-containing protein [Planctomycetota bacterium]|jgi:HEAT repeat protein